MLKWFRRWSSSSSFGENTFCSVVVGSFFTLNCSVVWRLQKHQIFVCFCIKSTDSFSWSADVFQGWWASPQRQQRALPPPSLSLAPCCMPVRRSVVEAFNPPLLSLHFPPKPKSLPESLNSSKNLSYLSSSSQFPPSSSSSSNVLFLFLLYWEFKNSQPEFTPKSKPESRQALHSKHAENTSAALQHLSVQPVCPGERDAGRPAGNSPEVCSGAAGRAGNLEGM